MDTEIKFIDIILIEMNLIDIHRHHILTVKEIKKIST